MNTKDLKIGDFAVNVSCNCIATTIGKKYPIIALTKNEFIIVDDDGDVYSSSVDNTDWSFEPNPFRLNTQKTIVEVTTKVLVTFEKTEIEHGEEYLIKTIELADMPALRKEVEYQVHNLANPQADDIIIKWENQ